MLALVFFLAGCERLVSSVNMEQPVSETPPAVLGEVGGTASVAAASNGSASDTPEPIGTLDFSTLPVQLPHSIKGYELYSWQTGEIWNFTLITGTNSVKSFEEIITPGNSVTDDGFIKLSVSGEEGVKKLLQLLPSGEAVVWGGMDLGSQAPSGTVYLTFPPQIMMDDLTAFCSNLGITLTSLKSQ